MIYLAKNKQTSVASISYKIKSALKSIYKSFEYLLFIKYDARFDIELIKTRSQGAHMI